MNLEERMKEKSFAAPIDAQMYKWRETILLEDAIRIAKEYAEEMCKKQREISVNIYSNLTMFEISQSSNGWEKLKNAPLATEAQDGK